MLDTFVSDTVELPVTVMASRASKMTENVIYILTTSKSAKVCYGLKTQKEGRKKRTLNKLSTIFIPLEIMK